MTREESEIGQTLIRDDEIFERMTLGERMQHGILVVCFLTLVVTGLPLLFYRLTFLDWIFSPEGSFWLRGVVHRVAAVGLFGVSLYHLFWVSCTQRGRQTFRDLLPVGRDLRDAFESFMHNVGLTSWLCRRGLCADFFRANPYWLFEAAPRYGRYNYIEKFEYLAVVWGNIVMMITGFFLWYPVICASLFPMWVYDVFRVIHGYEALLALLAIAIWHMYNVHLNPEVFPMSQVWLTGKITGRELRLLHPLEYEKIWTQRAIERRSQ